VTEETPFISFPPGALGPGAVRLPLLWDSPSACAFNKPRGLPAFQDSRLGGGPGSLLPEIAKRAAEGGQQFLNLGLQTPSLINLLDREASGIIVLARTAEAKATLRNAMGSMAFSFHYHFLAEGGAGPDELHCDLPLAIHRTAPRALVSHQTGKKTSTGFRRLQNFGNVSLWESNSHYDRFHQVRLHAMEVGLTVVGETLYGKATAATSSLYGSLCLHLARMRFADDAGEVELEAPYPGALKNLLRRLASRAEKSER
jgi:23S rRNA-/tRNA-specific pseudouridylate synthase